MSVAENVVVGIDIGGTYVKSGLVTQKGELLQKEKRPIKQDTREQLLEQLEEILRSWQGASAGDILAVGIGVPGFINHKTGMLDQSPNLPSLDGTKIFSEIRSRLHVPVVIENDANVAAWGEYWLGERNSDTEMLILVTLGTGIGSGIILNGKVWHGAAGYAGEFGHSLAVNNGERCNCGMEGCLESYFSTRALKRELQKSSAAEREASSLPTTGPVRGRELIDAALEGDQLASRILTEGAAWLGIGLGNLINILNPDKIVLGGGVIAAQELILPIITEATRKRSVPGAFNTCTIRPSELGNDAGLLGAAGLAWNAVKKSHA